jgi:hypothetical protein
MHAKRDNACKKRQMMCNQTTNEKLIPVFRAKYQRPAAAIPRWRGWRSRGWTSFNIFKKINPLSIKTAEFFTVITLNKQVIFLLYRLHIDVTTVSFFLD